VSEPVEPDPSSDRLRRRLGLLLVAGLLGIGAELILTGHYEDRDQTLPLAAIGACLLCLGWSRRSPGPASRRLLGASWILLAIVGGAGIVLHFRSNYDFQTELHPELGVAGRFLASLRATSPPSLAPGSLILLGALGLVTLRARPQPSPERS